MVSFYRKLPCDSGSKMFDFGSRIITSIDRGFQENQFYAVLWILKGHLNTIFYYHVKFTVDSC